MTESQPTREEFEALKRRVEQLESKIEDEPTAQQSTPLGLDQRDVAVLDWMRENGRRSKVQLVELYQSVTDITQRSTAKRRARELEQRPEYKGL